MSSRRLLGVLLQAGQAVWTTWAILVACLWAAGGCYRVAGPGDNAGAVRIEFVSSDTALVRTQAELHRALSEALNTRLGWRVAPNGAQRLALSIAQERIDATAGDRQGIAARWRITITGSAVFEHDGRVRSTVYTGIAHAGGLIDEAEAIAQATDDAAAHISSWLELER